MNKINKYIHNLNLSRKKKVKKKEVKVKESIKK